jgi:hypothetical protein
VEKEKERSLASETVAVDKEVALVRLRSSLALFFIF